MEWINIKNELPEKSGEYLTLWKWDDGGYCYQVSVFIKNSRNYGDVWDNAYSNKGIVTHWQPLPPPPSSHNSE